MAAVAPVMISMTGMVRWCRVCLFLCSICLLHFTFLNRISCVMDYALQ